MSVRSPLVRSLFVAAIIAASALLYASPVDACSEPQPGVHLPPNAGEMGEIPSDGALISVSILVGVSPEEAPEYVSLKVREEQSGESVSGTVQFYPVGRMPDERPREPTITAVGRGTRAAMVWRPDARFDPGTSYVAQLDVTSPQQSIEWPFDALEPRPGELVAASLEDLSLTAREAWGGDRRCCEVDGMSCGIYTECWFEDRVYLPTVKATVAAAPNSLSPVLRRVRRGDGTVVSASLVGDPEDPQNTLAAFEVDDEGPYCLEVETIDVATGDVIVGDERCIDASEMEPYDPQQETQPEPDFCDSASYQDNDGDGEPDDAGSGTGDGDGGDSSGDDGRGLGSGTTGEGCGCASSTDAAPSAVALLLAGLLTVGYRRRRRHR